MNSGASSVGFSEPQYSKHMKVTSGAIRHATPVFDLRMRPDPTVKRR
jgi:hypothetical protein